MSQEPRVVYCHCAYTRVLPAEVKAEVLSGLCESGRAFETVPDLCELAAKRAPELAAYTSGEAPLKIAACFPRAVRWLFHGAGTPLPERGVELLNMREQSAEECLDALLRTSPEGEEV